MVWKVTKTYLDTNLDKLERTIIIIAARISLFFSDGETEFPPKTKDCHLK